MNAGPSDERGEVLDCGHPKACLVEDPHEQDEAECAWCEEVRNLRSTIAALEEQLDKKALVLQPAEHDFSAEQVGLLRVLGGHVMLRCPTVRHADLVKGTLTTGDPPDLEAKG